MLKKKGLLIEVEGGEGSGKTTLINRLKTYLDTTAHVITHREPGGTAFAEDVRKLFMSYDNLSPETYVHLINAQREHNIEKVINPAITRGHIVIADRFLASTLVYQGRMEKQYDKIVKKAIDYPAVTLLVDTPADIGHQRIRDNKRETNRIDLWPLSKHRRVNQFYRQLGEYHPGRYWDIVLNGDRPFEGIDKQLARIAKDIRPYIKDHRTINELKHDLRRTHNRSNAKVNKSHALSNSNQLDVPIDHLSLPNQIVFALMRSRVYTVRDLIHMDHQRMQAIPRLGEKSMISINDALDSWLKQHSL